MVNYFASKASRRHAKLLEAIVGCNIPKVEKILGKIDANTQLKVDHGYMSPLYFSALLGYGAVVETLLKHGANPNYTNKSTSLTALHAACEKNYAEIACLLVENGADITLVDDGDQTPLDVTGIDRRTRTAVLHAWEKRNRIILCPNPACYGENLFYAKICKLCERPLILTGHYKIIRRLGEGGIAAVFLVEDQNLYDDLTDSPENVTYAMKQFRPENQLQKSSELFTREAAVLRLFEKAGGHPQIPKLHARFEQDGIRYLVMDYVDGKNPMTIVREDPHAARTIAERFLVHVLKALDFAHTQEVVHRDVKPENVIVRESDGEFILLDWGCAGMLGRTGGTKVYTPGFAPIEQAQGAVPDPWMDLHALGVSVCSLALNVDPRRVGTPFHLYCRKHEATIRTVLGDTISDATLRLMDEQTRYPTARAALEDLHFRMPEAVPTVPVIHHARTSSADDGVSTDLAASRVKADFVRGVPFLGGISMVGRRVEWGQVRRYVRDGNHPIVCTVGPPGLGKSKLICKVAKELEIEGQLGTEPIRAMLYVRPKTDSLVLSVFRVLVDMEVLPKSTVLNVEHLQGVELEDHLVEILESIASQRIVLVIDHLDRFLQAGSGLGSRRNAAVAKVLIELLCEVPTGIVVIATSATRLPLPPSVDAKLKYVPLCAGLSNAESVEMLRALDDEGKLGLTSCSEATLMSLARASQGVPAALKAIADRLHSDALLTPNALLPGSVTNKLPVAIEECIQAATSFAYVRANPNARRVLEVLAVFGRPVPAEAIEAVLWPQPLTPSTDAANSASTRLNSQSLSHATDGLNSSGCSSVDVSAALRSLLRDFAIAKVAGSYFDRAVSDRLFVIQPISSQYVYSQIPTLSNSSPSGSLCRDVGLGEFDESTEGDVDFERDNTSLSCSLSEQSSKSMDVRRAEPLTINEYHTRISLYYESLLMNRPAVPDSCNRAESNPTIPAQSDAESDGERHAGFTMTTDGAKASTASLSTAALQRSRSDSVSGTASAGELSSRVRSRAARTKPKGKADGVMDYAFALGRTLFGRRRSAENESTKPAIPVPILPAASTSSAQNSHASPLSLSRKNSAGSSTNGQSPISSKPPSADASAQVAASGRAGLEGSDDVPSASVPGLSQPTTNGPAIGRRNSTLAATTTQKKGSALAPAPSSPIDPPLEFVNVGPLSDMSLASNESDPSFPNTPLDLSAQPHYPLATSAIPLLSEAEVEEGVQLQLLCRQFWHRIVAGDVAVAYHLLLKTEDLVLRSWRDMRMLVWMSRRLRGILSLPSELSNVQILAFAYYYMGAYDLAEPYLLLRWTLSSSVSRLAGHLSVGAITTPFRRRVSEVQESLSARRRLPMSAITDISTYDGFSSDGGTGATGETKFLRTTTTRSSLPPGTLDVVEDTAWWRRRSVPDTLGVVYMAHGKISKAADVYLQMLRENEDIGPTRGRGADREKDGPSCESSTADLSLRQARARRRTGTALMRLAEVQMMSGCFVEALSFLDKATDLLRPYGGIAYVEALCTIGNLYRALGSADKAKDDISFALILAYRADCVPVAAKCHHALAKTYHSQQRYDEARRHYANVLRLGCPSIHYRALADGAVLCLEFGHYETATVLLQAAQDECTRVLRYSSRHVDCLFTRALVSLAAGDSTASRYYDEAIANCSSKGVLMFACFDLVALRRSKRTIPGIEEIYRYVYSESHKASEPIDLTTAASGTASPNLKSLSENCIRTARSVGSNPELVDRLAPDIQFNGSRLNRHSTGTKEV
eukprot:Rmarinus@m.2440